MVYLLVSRKASTLVSNVPSRYLPCTCSRSGAATPYDWQGRDLSIAKPVPNLCLDRPLQHMPHMRSTLSVPIHFRGFGRSGLASTEQHVSNMPW